MITETNPLLFAYLFFMHECTLMHNKDCPVNKHESVQFNKPDGVSNALKTSSYNNTLWNTLPFLSSADEEMFNEGDHSYQKQDQIQNFPLDLSKNAVDQSSLLLADTGLNNRRLVAHKLESHNNNRVSDQVMALKRKSSSSSESYADSPLKINHDVQKTVKKRKEKADSLRTIKRYEPIADGYFLLTLKTPLYDKNCMMTNTKQKQNTTESYVASYPEASSEKCKSVCNQSNFDQLVNNNMRDDIFDNNVKHKTILYCTHSCSGLNNIDYYRKFLFIPDTLVQKSNQILRIKNSEKLFFQTFFYLEVQNINEMIPTILDNNLLRSNPNLMLFTYLCMSLPEIAKSSTFYQELDKLCFTYDDNEIGPFLSMNLKYEIVGIGDRIKECISQSSLESENEITNLENLTEHQEDNIGSYASNYRNKIHSLTNRKEPVLFEDEDKTETQRQEKFLAKDSRLFNNEYTYEKQEENEETNKINEGSSSENELVLDLKSKIEEFVDLSGRIKNIIFTNKYKKQNKFRKNLFFEMPELIFYIDWRYENCLSNENEMLCSNEKELIDKVLSCYDSKVVKHTDNYLRDSINSLRNYIKDSLNDSTKTEYPQKIYYNVALYCLTQKNSLKTSKKSNLCFVFLLLSFTLNSTESLHFFEKFIPVNPKKCPTPNVFFYRTLLRSNLVAFHVAFTLNCIVKFMTKINSQTQDYKFSILYPFKDKILVFSKCGPCDIITITYAGTSKIADYFYNEIAVILIKNQFD